MFIKEWRANGRPDKVNVGPTDGQGYCICDKCRALDIPNTLDVADPMDIIMNRDLVSLAGRYLDLWRRLLDRMRPENPNVQMRSLVYSGYRIATDDFAPLGHPKDAFIGSYVNDNWSERERNSIAVWQDKIGIELFLRPNDWHVGHAAPYLPLHKAGNFMKSALARGLVGCAYDTALGYWATQGLNYYLTARLINYPDMTVDQIIDEYASGFGQAASAIKEYIAHWKAYSYKIGAPDWMGRFEDPDSLWKRELEKRGLNSDAFHGSWYMLPFLYTDDVLARGHAILDQANTLADNDRIVLERIAFFRDGLRYLALARDVVALANNQIRNKPESVEEAAAQASEFERLRRRLLNELPSLTRRHVIWADEITQHEARRRVKIGIRNFEPILISAITDWGQWRFRKDSKDAGVEEKWYRADLGMDETGWIPIQVPAFWDRTIGRYEGFGWYRTTFRMPSKWEHPVIHLNFGAVDEQAWVYLNGVFVGEHTIASESASDIEGARTITIGDMWETPFTISVPVEHVKLGAENTLVVRVHNEKGAGGIHKHVTISGPMADKMVLSDMTELGDGLVWQPGETYNDLNMVRRGSARAEVTVDEKTQGIIMEAGATGAGLALYVHDGDLYFQAGKGDEFPAEEGQVLIRVPIKAGRHVVEWSADPFRSKTMLRVNGKVVGVSGKRIFGYLADDDPGGVGGIPRVAPSSWRLGGSYTDLAMAKSGSARAEVTVDEKTQGVIMEAGATGAGMALYIHDGNLYFQAGRGNEFPAKDGQSLISVPISPGRHVIEWSADKTEAMLRVNGEVVGVSEQPVRMLAGNDPGGIGGIHGGGICRNAGRWLRGKDGRFNDTIHSVTVWPENGVCQNAGGWRKGKDGQFTGTIHSVTVWPDKAVY